MVYTADGKPLYIPPRKHDAAERTGMQSLLSAIELEMANGRNVQSQELLDLIHTKFTNEDTTLSADVDTSQVASQEVTIPSSLLHDSIEPHSASNAILSPLENLPFARTSRKRKWAGLDHRWNDKGVRTEQIRSVITDHLHVLSSRGDPALALLCSRLTTIKCAYPSVAQKSYGIEKRLLTPAPFCTISGLHKPFFGDIPVAHMSIHAESATTGSLLHSAAFATGMRTTFRALHINNGTVGKSKSFNLRLQIAERGKPRPAEIPFAEFDTSELAIISKASKKATRQRDRGSYIHSGGTIALYNRINSQTVRTKYLAIEDEKFAIKADQWTAFQIDLIGDATQLIPEETQAISYGHIVTLTDLETGIKSEPMRIRRLDKNLVEDDAVGNVSQMQKVVFERIAVTLDGAVQERTFLSALHAQKIQRDPGGESDSSAVYLPYNVVAEGIRLDDSALWTLVGINFFEYTFLDTLTPEGAQQVLDPELRDQQRPLVASESSSLLEEHISRIQTPITPFPTLMAQPIYLDGSARLHLQIRDFWHMQSELPTPEIWLGACGPLAIIALQQSEKFATDAALEVALPSKELMSGVRSAPLLFVRLDGIVFPAGCIVTWDS